MGITDILKEDFVTLCLIAGMFLFIFSKRSVDKRTNHHFAVFLIVILAVNISEIADRYMSFLPYLNNMRYLACAIGYALRPVTLVIVIEVLLRFEKRRILLWIPVIANAVLSFLSCYNHLMFYFEPDNSLMHGPIGYVPHIISAAYLLMLVVLTVKNQEYLDPKEPFLIYYLAFICTLATLMEMYCDAYFVLSGAMMVSCTLYYMFFYVQSNKKDELTGLLNRNTFLNDVSALKGHSYALISIDMNGLKNVNDNRGHAEGDKALEKVSSAIMTCADSHVRIYRVGGDEFMLIGRRKSEDETRKLIESMRSALLKTKYMCSFGYTMVSGNDDFNDACKTADSRMYDDKRKYKHR